MSEPREPQPAKLIAGILFRDFTIQRETLKALSKHFGPLDFLTAPRRFSYTSYYEKEMGPELLRQTASFLNLVQPESLADIKHMTNEIEHLYSRDERRQINIDPGILSEERLVLATGKNAAHRIYLRRGIFADLTLIYQNGTYRALPWTYPDYREPCILHFLGVLRQKLAFQKGRRLPAKIKSKGERP